MPLAYRAEDDPGSLRRVLAERRANCYDGALFAAAALRRLGHRPLLLDLPAVRDDDHVLAVFRLRGRWGAVAKSNFAGLRFREPIFRDVRELAASYFEDYFNLRGEKTLRSYSVPFDLSRLDSLEWTFRDQHLREIANASTAPATTGCSPGHGAGARQMDARSSAQTDLAGVHAGP